MAFVLSDRIKETTTTTGTGTYTLGGAVSGFETFTANLSNGDTTYYCCTDGTDFEVGLGTFTSSGTTLARTTIISSSNSNNAVSWSSGSRDIFCTLPGSKAIAKNGDGDASFADSEKIRFGSDNDGFIEHTGSIMRVFSSTGGLSLKTTADDQDVTIQTDDGSGGTTDYLRADGSTGAVKLSHYGSTKLETTSGGVTITGALTGNVTGDLTGNADTASSVAADNLSAGDSAVNLRTTSGNITIDAQGNDTDIIFKGTDNSSDITMLTLDGSGAGTATFNNKVVAAGGIESSSYFWMKTDNNVSLYAGANFEVLLQHVHNTGLRLINNGTGTPAVELQFRDSDEAIGTDGTNLKLTSGGNEITVPNSGADTMTLNAATQTLTNKTLTSPKINEDVAVTATATEINKLDGVTATTTELNYLDITTLGTVEASKAVTANSSGNIESAGKITSLRSRLTSTSDVSLSSTSHPFQIGASNTTNMAIDSNEIMARNNGSTSTLFLNINGGLVEVGSGGLGLRGGNIIFEGATTNDNETTLTVVDPTADRTITLPDATGTVLTTGNSDTPTTTTSSSDADFVLVDDGGTMKKITPSNLGITSGGASKGFAVAMAIAL